MGWAIGLSYLAASVLFMLGLKLLSSPATARRGNALSALGMLLAVTATLLSGQILSFGTIAAGAVIGGIAGVVSAQRVKMTGMPEMVALFNGSGGAASALVAVSEYLRVTPGTEDFVLITILLSVIVGAVTFSGSAVAFGKLAQLIPGRPIVYPGQHVLNGAVVAVIAALSALVYASPGGDLFFYGIALGSLVLGVLAVIPIGGADMPVVISLLNSYSGVAVAMTGFVLKNHLLIIVGSLVGSSGLILTKIMCDAMHRSLFNVLFGAFGAAPSGEAVVTVKGAVKPYSIEDAATILENSSYVIIVPGYGMAASRAQMEVKELSDALESRGATVKFAIHPVAGRMPGHMNVLLAEADVPYEKLYAMEDINEEFSRADAAVVIGANDVVNPAARTNPGSPLYGMPILNADRARTVIVLKRSMAPGFSGVENELFLMDNTMMLFGDAKKTLSLLVERLRKGF